MKDLRYLIGLIFRNQILSLLQRYTFQPIKAEHLSVTIFIQKTISVLTISGPEKVPQRFHQCIAMLSPPPIVIDFEGYRLTNQPFFLKEPSAQGVDYHDTSFWGPPHSSNILNTRAPETVKLGYKTYTVSLGILIITITLSSSVFSLALICESPTYWCTQGVEKSVSIWVVFSRTSSARTSWVVQNPRSSIKRRFSFAWTIKKGTTGTTAKESKLACSSIGSAIASNHNNNSNNNNNNISKKNLFNISSDQMIKDNLRLVLSPYLTISVSTIQNATTSNHLNNCSIDFVEEEYTKNGYHKLLRKTVIDLSPAEFFQLKSRAISIDSFLQSIDKKNVRPTSAELDEGAENPTAGATTTTWSHHITWHRSSSITRTDGGRTQIPRKYSGNCLFTSIWEKNEMSIPSDFQEKWWF